MYKIVIFCGGTGSISIQKGLHKLLGNTSVKVDLVINAYDNGKSTGACRRLFHNKILGPSDMRKNQLTQYKIRYADKIKDKESKEAKLLRLFELRFSEESYETYYKRSKKIIQEASFLKREYAEYFIQLLDYFFFEEKEIRKGIEEIEFKDFALSNIFYVSCAALNHNSLSFAGSRMAKILHIPNNVHLISDVSLLLKAKTQSGKVIEDEGEIVSWKNGKDRIANIFLQDERKKEYIPAVDENIYETPEKVSQLMLDSDIIIFSSGTQWSSLIPTYLHKEFKNLLDRAKAKKYLIMNNTQDEDMTGVGSDEICTILNQYIDLKEITIILNENADAAMKKRLIGYRYIQEVLGDKKSGKHDAVKLVSCILKDFYGKAIGKTTRIFDLDGTLWNERGSQEELEIGRENMKLFSGMIVSGNSYEHVKDILQTYYTGENIDVFCDYGNTHFLSSCMDKKEYLTKNYFVDTGIVEELKKTGIKEEKMKLRGGVVLTIKPLKNRDTVLKNVKDILKNSYNAYTANLAGHTSIDICNNHYSKAVMIEKIIEKYGLDKNRTIFIGNEIEAGNEEEIKNLNICTLQVNDVFECNVYLRTVLLCGKREKE